MFLKTSNLPYSLFRMLIDGGLTVDERYSFRPDRVAGDIYRGDFFVEAMCNEASNVSPLSLEPGVRYLLPSYAFLKNFLEVGS